MPRHPRRAPAEAPAVAAPVEPEPPVVVAPAEPEPPVVVAPAEPEVVPEPVRAVLDRDLPADLDLDALATAVDASVDERLDGGAIERVLDLAAAYRRVGRMDAALDACYLALAISPDDLGLHLALVELYDERGWTSLADEKLALLDRLSAFDEAGTAAARVGAARAARD